MLVAVDPGLVTSGIAIFKNDKLAFADIIRSGLGTKDRLELRVFDMTKRLLGYVSAKAKGDTLDVVCEFQQIYDARYVSKIRGKNPNDLLPLTLIAGGVLQVYPQTRLIKPAEWKRQVPKEICASRIYEELNLTEREKVDIIAVKSLAHNAIDAIGIGLVSIKRLKEGCVK